MFTTGQWTFAIFFIIAFVILLIYSYKGDRRLHQKHYKGSLWILVCFLAFVGLLFIIKIVMNK
ncbi:hypothetical protein [Flavimarina sp. Hel_I_48]|uniref:hypothetical protein n=1 Tax=Flavimarina sp. Hel_I_48 TaxID=1392488 RepID=UPI0009DF54E6|nr:hypothetical protein [Flavimarina sp. Hel_I_48]